MTLESDRLVGAGRAEDLSRSADNGDVQGTYERTWGCYQSAVESCFSRRPRVDVKVRLSKERYQPVEMTFRLDKMPKMSGDVPVDLGTVLLKPIDGMK